MDSQKMIKGSFTIDKNAKITSRSKHIGSSLTSLRTSSKGDQKEGLGETVNPYSSNFLPFAEDENTYASKLKLDISKIQDEINKLDIDGKIRNPTNLELKFKYFRFFCVHDIFFLSNFRKNYISVIQKWLLRNSETNIKESLENKFNFNPEPEKLMEILNVKTPQDGLRKLFKLFSSIF